MRLVLVALLVVGLLVGVAFADETGGAVYNSPNGKANKLADLLNEQDCIDHTHAYDVDREDQAGVGVDLVVYENEKETVAVKVEEKYDFNNEENSVYAVCEVNLWKMFKKEK